MSPFPEPWQSSRDWRMKRCFLDSPEGLARIDSPAVLWFKYTTTEKIALDDAGRSFVCFAGE